MRSTDPMDKSGSPGLRFSGDPARFVRKAGILFLTVAPFPAVMLFGQKAAWVFALGCVPAGLVLIGLYFLLRLIDHAKLDDTARLIAPSFGRPVSYASIEEIRFEPDGELTRISFRRGTRRGRLLLAAGADETLRLRQALLGRCPAEVISEKSRSSVKGAAMVIGLLISLHASLLYYGRQKWPVAAIGCSEFQWPEATATGLRRPSQIDGLNYSIPARFNPSNDAADPEMHRYLDSATGQEIRVYSARLATWLAPQADTQSEDGLMSIPSAPFLLRLIGIHSTVDLMRWPYCDRIGAIPALLKAALIAPGAEPWSLRLHELERKGWTALIEIESSGNTSSASILAASPAGNEEIIFAIKGEGDPETALIAALLNGFGFPE